MDNDFGISISAPNVDVRKASNSQLFMSTKYPFLKLDTQSSVSFQTITLLFNNDPPEPSGGTDAITTVYSFAHGYTYTPRIWSLFQTVIAPVSTNLNQSYFQDSGIIAEQTVDDQVSMYATADATNVYIKVDKFNDGTGSANNLVGSSFKITIFVFVDDLNS